MRTLKAGSFQRLASLPSLWRAWLACRRGKRRTAKVAAFEIDCDQHLLTLQRELAEGRYRPAAWRLHGIRDPKTRLIAAPAVRDRVVHHAVLHEIGPVFERRFIEQSFAAGQGRGPQRAALYFLAGQRRHPWRLQLDISAYFPSIAHDRLLNLLAERVRDADTLTLLQSIIASGEPVYRSRLAAQWLGDRCPSPGRGLPLGSWFSQWCGNFYLDGLDHFIKRDLKIPMYLRYMDDLALFAGSKQSLLDARSAIGDWLHAQRGLSLNPKRLAVEPTRTAATFVGYRISRAGIAPGRKLRRNFRRRLRVAGDRGEESLIRSIRSYRGLLVFP